VAPLRTNTHKSPAALALLLTVLLASVGCRSHPVATVPIPEVTVSHPSVQNVTDYLTFTGNTAASDSVKLVARVEGYLDQQHFVDGATVKKGDPLFTIQQQPYTERLQQAEAQLAAQRASLWHGQTEFKRYGRLLQQDAATQTEVDHWRYEKEAAEAGVKSAEAQVSIAKLNLSYTVVKAPFDGHLGRHLVDPGNVVGAGGELTALAWIDRLDTLYVYFTINERDLLRAEGAHRRRESLSVQPRPISYGLLNEQGFPHSGLLDFGSLTVDSTTGALQLRATISNPERNLMPGLFVRVRVPTAEHRGALIVPGDAVSFDQQGEYVLIIDKENRVERRGVKTGAQFGEGLVIDEGLKPSDWVIVEGQMEAIPSREVRPNRAETSLRSSSASR
jgi:RND family efflux transporter MFP subunit